MDDSLLELENELKRLRPRAPSVKMLGRIEAGITAPEIQSAVSHRASSIIDFWLNWRMVATAAMVAAFALVLVALPRLTVGDSADAVSPVVAVMEVSVPATPTAVPEANAVVSIPAIDRYQPVGAASVLYDLKEDSVVTVPDRTPVRRVRYRYVDTYIWKNPVTNASLKWSVPRDEVRVLPASLH